MQTPGVHLWLVLWKAYAALRREADRSIAESGVGYSDFAVLEVLLHKGPLPVNTIGPRVELTSGSISVAIDRLEERGLVERRASPEDRRRRLVCLTREGRRLIEPVFARHAAAMERAAHPLAQQDRAQLVALLKKLGGAG